MKKIFTNKIVVALVAMLCCALWGSAFPVIKIGYKLGIGGVLTFKNSRLFEVIEKIDLKDILLETDSPYLSPEPYRGRKNNPSNVYYVAKKIAEIKNIKIEEVIKVTTNNCKELFDI